MPSNPSSEKYRRNKAAQRARKAGSGGSNASRLEAIRANPTRAWDVIEDEPSLRHIGDVEGIVNRADMQANGAGNLYITVNAAHLLTAMEAAFCSAQGSNVVLRLYTVDPPEFDDEDDETDDSDSYPWGDDA